MVLVIEVLQNGRLKAHKLDNAKVYKIQGAKNESSNNNCSNEARY